MVRRIDVMVQTFQQGAKGLRSVPVLPPPPACSFASDNAARVHPAVLDAIARANDGHALAYGSDPWTERAVTAMRRVFGHPVEVAFTWGGTGANVVGLQSLVRPWDSGLRGRR